MKVPEQYRLVHHDILGSDASYGNNGCFIVSFRGREMTVIASDGEGWEHVSVSLNNRNPNWEEMSYIKSLFWDDEECVIQYHPPKSEYINMHPHCLHMWRPKDKEIPMPPSILVGIKKKV